MDDCNKIGHLIKINRKLIEHNLIHLSLPILEFRRLVTEKFISIVKQAYVPYEREGQFLFPGLFCHFFRPFSQIKNDRPLENKFVNFFESSVKPFLQARLHYNQGKYTNLTL